MNNSNKKQKLEILLNQANNDSFYKTNWPTTENEGQLMLDVFQDEDNIYVKSTIAGVLPQDLEISLNNDMLTIRGNRSHEQKAASCEYFYRECYWGKFSRSIILPIEVQVDKVSAILKNGVLTITLPKVKKQRNIPVKLEN
ncbi:MAG: Hsp20/alpha crystallin family protein [Candidatus Buchananbacteria bacterium]